MKGSEKWEAIDCREESPWRQPDHQRRRATQEVVHLAGELVTLDAL